MSQFNIVALGDSIMWGQGLRQPDKFVQKTCDWLATQRHEGAFFEPHLRSYAHSGATARATRRDPLPAEWGEIPEPAPSIGAQLERALADSASGQGVDLVLLNGGINDISAFGVVVANPFDPNGVDALVSTTRTKLTCFMVPLIERALAAFPNANIVVLGYYPRHLAAYGCTPARAPDQAPTARARQLERVRRSLRAPAR